MIFAPSCWNFTAAEAMRNSMTPRNPDSRRRMKSSVQPVTTPSEWTGSQLVTPCTVRSASIATRQRTASSASSSSPPRVKPISGNPLSATHSSEIARI